MAWVNPQVSSILPMTPWVFPSKQAFFHPKPLSVLDEQRLVLKLVGRRISTHTCTCMRFGNPCHSLHLTCNILEKSWNEASAPEFDVYPLRKERIAEIADNVAEIIDGNICICSGWGRSNGDWSWCGFWSWRNMIRMRLGTRVRPLMFVWWSCQRGYLDCGWCYDNGGLKTDPVL